MLRRFFLPIPTATTCRICSKSSVFISKTLSICADCIKNKPEDAILILKELHAQSRAEFSLPSEPPRDANGVKCNFCVNECKIGEGMKGYCGLRTNEKGKLKHLGGTIEKGIVECYYDPLPTNCVAENFCAGGCGAGYPKFAYSKGRPEYGYKNLAVFYGACTFNCLFCQNWHYRNLARNLQPTMSAKELANWVNDKTSCICYFGGDPTPQMPHAIAVSRYAIEKRKGKILRICWESNGTMSKEFLKKMAELSFESGGCIKFDLKTWDENLNIALCGVTNKRTLENFGNLAEYVKDRKEPPFLIASTLLIPGYVEVEEVKKISEFISALDPTIPYSLLAFYPQFYMLGLPTTSRKLAEDCSKVAKEAGLKNVRIGNIHLLS